MRRSASSARTQATCSRWCARAGPAGSDCPQASSATSASRKRSRSSDLDRIHGSGSRPSAAISRTSAVGTSRRFAISTLSHNSRFAAASMRRLVRFPVVVAGGAAKMAINRGPCRFIEFPLRAGCSHNGIAAFLQSTKRQTMQSRRRSRSLLGALEAPLLEPARHLIQQDSDVSPVRSRHDHSAPCAWTGPSRCSASLLNSRNPAKSGKRTCGRRL